jgi:hypothetical protein
MSTAVINASKVAEQLTPAFVTAIKNVNAALATPLAHADKGTLGDLKYTITSPNGAGTTAALYLLTKEIINAVRKHCTDDTGHGPTGSAAHKVVDGSAEFLAIPLASTVISLATAYTALNALDAWKQAHCPSTTYHYAADSTYAATSAAAATTQGSADTLANELKTDLNAHFALGLADLPILQPL